MWFRTCYKIPVTNKLGQTYPYIQGQPIMCVCDLLNLFCIPSPPLCEPYFKQYQYKQWQEEQNKQIRVSGKQFAHSSNVSSHPNTHSINETMQRGGWLVQR
jgi:hypothetical protein